MDSPALSRVRDWPTCPKCRQSATGVYAGAIACIRCLGWRWSGDHRQYCVVAPVLIGRAA